MIARGNRTRAKVTSGKETCADDGANTKSKYEKYANPAMVGQGKFQNKGTALGRKSN